MSSYLDALRNELGFLRMQPNVNERRVSEVEAEIARVEPEPDPEREVERAVVEEPENTAGPASRRAKKKA